MSEGALAALLAHSLGVPVRTLRSVPGGDINQAFEVVLNDGQRVFVKTRPNCAVTMYAREAEGLRYLAETRALRTPGVLAINERFLVLEWITSAVRRPHFEEELGRGLAQLHKFGAQTFGLAHDNFIGSLAQDNTETHGWAEFYAQRRLLALTHTARRAGTLPQTIAGRIVSVCERLPALCGPAEPPSRLHGDLWSGNVMSDAEGAPVLIDPAVYGGDREIDLAMLELFGAPSERFFAAYDEIYPRRPGSAERVALYQLYPLLVHVCLFGSGYVRQLERALAPYA